MVLKVKLDEDTPVLSKLAGYKSSPSYSMQGLAHPGRQPNGLGPGEYPPVSLDKTSKYQTVGRNFSFAHDQRFPEDRIVAKKPSNTTEPGPGAYDCKLDYTHIPFKRASSATLGSGERLFPMAYFNNGKSTPGPVYDVAGRDNRNEPTLSRHAAILEGRHGMYYDSDIGSRKSVPGPGQYEPKESAKPLSFGFGKSKRPQLNTAKKSPGPGQYDLKDSGTSIKSFSFGKASLNAGSVFARAGKLTPGTMTGQPTQFTR